MNLIVFFDLTTVIPLGELRRSDAPVFQDTNHSEKQNKELNYCDPAGIRTQGPYIKSVMLYQLSYGIMLLISQLRVQRYVLKAVYQIVFL